MGSGSERAPSGFRSSSAPGALSCPAPLRSQDRIEVSVASLAPSVIRRAGSSPSASVQSTSRYGWGRPPLDWVLSWLLQCLWCTAGVPQTLHYCVFSDISCTAAVCWDHHVPCMAPSTPRALDQLCASFPVATEEDMGIRTEPWSQVTPAQGRLQAPWRPWGQPGSSRAQCAPGH